jgi:hypothetical protein
MKKVMTRQSAWLGTREDLRTLGWGLGGERVFIDRDNQGGGKGAKGVGRGGGMGGGSNGGVSRIS